MWLYFVRPINVSYDVGKRVSTFHKRVFHGRSVYPERDREPGPRRPGPALTNQDREPAHISRSGRFVPPVFSPRIYELIVNENLKERLSKLPNVEFVEVVFERLIDLGMAALGDFSRLGNEPPTIYEQLRMAPDVAEFHQTIGTYFSVLGANMYALQGKYEDAAEVAINFGSYWPGLPKSALISARALKDYPILRGDAHVFREDAFAIIAPYLDLDYYAVAFLEYPREEDPPHLREWLQQQREQFPEVS